jgi:hypothetical protein
MSPDTTISVVKRKTKHVTPVKKFILTEIKNKEYY